jgi:hypothetical protein
MKAKLCRPREHAPQGPAPENGSDSLPERRLIEIVPPSLGHLSHHEAIRVRKEPEEAGQELGVRPDLLPRDKPRATIN